MSLDKRIEKLEERAGMTDQKYPQDCLIEYDETMTLEDIGKIMDERFKRSGTSSFILLPKKTGN